MKLRIAWVMIALVACSSAPEVARDDGPRQPADPAPGTVPGMALLATAHVSATRTVDFFETENGIAIRDLAPLDELKAKHLDLDRLRGLGMQGMFRAVVNDERAEVPAALTSAEERWRAKYRESPPPVAREAPPSLRRTVGAAHPVAAPSQGPRPSGGGGEQLGTSQQALSGDAAWWQSQSFCQWQTGSGVTLAWYDDVWCPVDVPWADAGWADAMYHEATIGGEDGPATLVIDQWVGTWKTVLFETVPYRWGGTWSLPPQNGAIYHTFAHGLSAPTGGAYYTNIALSVRSRYSMPIPQSINFAPSNAQYDFANDIDGIEFDGEDLFMTRSKFTLAGGSTPQGGQISIQFFADPGAAQPNYLTKQPEEVHDMPADWKRAGYNHFGDLTLGPDGNLYVSMEGDAGAAVGVYDGDAFPIDFAALDTTPHCPWIAYNPRNDLYYTTLGSSSQLAIFDIKTADQAIDVKATRVGTLNLSAAGGDQGGKFSPRGNLWSTSGYGGSSTLRLYAIDTVNGFVHYSAQIPANGADEGEGILLYDFDANPNQNGMQGQIHVQVLKNNVAGAVGQDTFELEHFRADMSRL
jgi:hypothetical protein